MDKLKGVLKMETEMNDLKVGDRVKVISVPAFIKKRGEEYDVKVMPGMTGTVNALYLDGLIGVEFDIFMGGHYGDWNGKNGHCWYLAPKHLEKIEDTEGETEEETKAEKMEQKILTVLRKEIGVLIGDEFDVYENGEKKWICRFEVRGFSHLINGELYKSGVWKDIVYNFCRYTFKRKPFAPECGEDYFFLGIEYDEIKSITFRALQSTWIGSSIDYGMLAVGNIFRTEEEALKRKDKLLEKLEKLRKAK